MIDLKRTVYLIGDINDEKTPLVWEKILEIHSKDCKTSGKPINLIINSGGGHVMVMFSFYDLVPLLDINLHTIGSGLIGSAAVIIFCTGRKRMVTPNSVFFFHEIGLRFEQIRLTDGDYRYKLNHLKKSNEQYAKIVASKSNLSKKDVLDMMKEEVYIYPSEALKMGLVDEIVK
jgi:ATP-dependent Clp protease protease subunit